ncbi:phosphopantetheine-binding protein [Sinorhizobium meliloti]|uniref:phosphopantetheine-binding protein n=1 Tax=Rhizobium meliloti TaxID=382 RepID=UPI0001E4AB56|nr:phosphopantetheine-binding protein [Sinorhizobium meliloti]AEG53139.1 phosphopantetheine-binding protein [Sinorhizobium meliloti AK83]MDE4591146.1 phosphopantetheine-binding protein [Sinorhizobium meliloti]SEI55913.1 acyl carrier protein [Sinorhizobium meliloti]
MQLEQDIFERVKLTLVNCQHFPAERIQPDSTFEQLELDSLDAVEMVILLEEEFNIDIDDELVTSARSVPDVVSYIKGKSGNGNYRA